MHCCKRRESTLGNKQAESEDRRRWAELPVAVPAFVFRFLSELRLINTTVYQQGE